MESEQICSTPAPPELSNHPISTSRRLRVALYTRVSTKHKGQESANQLTQLQDSAAAHGWAIVREYEYQESDGEAERAQFQTMMAEAAQRKFDVLLFWALECLSREGVYETHLYLKRLDDAGVRFRSFTEPYLDSCGMFRDAVISILGVIAKQERIWISERVTAGLRRAQATGTRSGKPIGRPRVIFHRDRVLYLRNAGRSWREISKETGVSIATVRRVYGQFPKGNTGCQNPPEAA